MVTRRDWLVYTGLTGLAAATGALSRAGLQPPLPASTPAAGASLAAPEAPPPWWAFAPFGVGSALASGWSLASLSAVREGRAVLMLDHDDGSRAEIHLRRLEPSGRHADGVGVAQSQRFDFILMNDSRGDRDTREILGRLILALAAHVRRNEPSAPDGAMASFTAHRESSRGASPA